MPVVPFIAQSHGLNPTLLSAADGLLATNAYLVMIDVVNSVTATGVMFVQTTQGDYTASNYNGVGLYSFSGGTLTLIASSKNEGALWKQPAPSVKRQNFSATVDLGPGQYWIAALYNRSAEVVQPFIAGGPNVVTSIVRALDTGVSTYAFTTSITALPSTIILSTMAAAAPSPWFALY
jgi:hypothetical protein